MFLLLSYCDFTSSFISFVFPYFGNSNCVCMIIIIVILTCKLSPEKIYFIYHMKEYSLYLLFSSFCTPYITRNFLLFFCINLYLIHCLSFSFIQALYCVIYIHKFYLLNWFIIWHHFCIEFCGKKEREKKIHEYWCDNLIMKRLNKLISINNVFNIFL